MSIKFNSLVQQSQTLDPFPIDPSRTLLKLLLSRWYK